MSLDGYGLVGAQASNYTLNSVPGKINRLPLQLSGLSVPARFADLGSTPIVSGTPKLNTPLSGEVVSLSGIPTGTFDSTSTFDVLTVTFDVNSVTLVGRDAPNYSLIMQGPVITRLLPRSLNTIYDKLLTLSDPYHGQIATFKRLGDQGQLTFRTKNLRDTISSNPSNLDVAFAALRQELQAQIANACSACTFSDQAWNALENDLKVKLGNN